MGKGPVPCSRVPRQGTLIREPSAQQTALPPPPQLIGQSGNLHTSRKRTLDKMLSHANTESQSTRQMIKHTLLRGIAASRVFVLIGTEGLSSQRVSSAKVLCSATRLRSFPPQ